MDQSSVEPGVVQSVQTKLQSLHASMTDAEQAVLEGVLTQAAQGAGAAAGNQHAIIFVGGRSGQIRIPMGTIVHAPTHTLPPPGG